MFLLWKNSSFLRMKQRFTFLTRNAKFWIYPKVSLFDEVVNVSVDDVKPKGLFTICSHTSCGQGNTFTSIAIYQARENGTIDMSKDNSIGGMFKGIHPMGFIWAMQPSPKNKKPHAKLKISDVESPLKVSFEIHKGVIPDLETYIATAKNPLAQNTLYRMVKCPGVQRIQINEDIQGTLFIPDGNGPFPGVITIYGDPNEIEQRAALLASRGILSLALAFYGRPGLTAKPGGRIELEYFEKAIKFLGSHPKVRSNSGIGIIGTCSGGTMALSSGAKLGGISAVVAINPSVYTDIGYLTHKDTILPKSPIIFPKYKVKPSQSNTWSGYTCPKKGFEEEYLIPFHTKKDVDYMFLFSEDDKHVPTYLYRKIVENLLKKVNHEKYKIITYEKAGHLLDIPNLPLCKKEWFPIWQAIVPYGGEPEHHNKAAINAWKNIVKFFHQVL